MQIDGHSFPVFPLPDLVLFPGVKVPLHIFEPRYVQMINDQLDSLGFFVLATYCSSEQEDFYSTACLAKIIDYKEVENDHYNIIIEGTEIVRIHEVDSNRLYRQVRTSPYALNCVKEEPEDISALKKHLIVFLKNLNNQLGLTPEYADTVEQMDSMELIQYMSFMAPVPIANKQELLEQKSLKEKVRLLLQFYQS